MEKGIFITPEELSTMMANAASKALNEYISTSALNEKKSSEIQRNPKVIRGYKGLCDFLGISSTTLWRLKKSKKIPYVQRGRVLLFNTDEVLKAMQR